jgi:hypothetical protein
MNYLTLINFQRIIFSILFILSGLYLIVFILKEIFMLFIPTKKTQTVDLYQLLANTNNKDIKILPYDNKTHEIANSDITVQPSEKIVKEPTAPTKKIIKVEKPKKERKSRKRKEK